MSKTTITIKTDELEKVLEEYSDDVVELTNDKVEETIELFDLLFTNILELDTNSPKTKERA